MLLDLIKIFGPVIHSTLSASSLVGVDLQAGKRYATKFTWKRELGVAKRDVVKTCVATSLPRNSVRGGKLDTNLCSAETVAPKRTA